MNYSERTNRQPDFRIRYLWRPEAAEPFQHMRCDFAYFGDQEAHAYMIWPEFETPDHDPVGESASVPHVGTATMWILDDNMRAFHRGRIAPAVRGHLVVGQKIIADVDVVEVLGLK